jgi:hypothetical protein
MELASKLGDKKTPIEVVKVEKKSNKKELLEKVEKS